MNKQNNIYCTNPIIKNKGNNYNGQLPIMATTKNLLRPYQTPKNNKQKTLIPPRTQIQIRQT